MAWGQEDVRILGVSFAELFRKQCAAGTPVLKFGFERGDAKPHDLESHFDILWLILDKYPGSVPGVHLLAMGLVYANHLCDDGQIFPQDSDEDSLSLDAAGFIKELIQYLRGLVRRSLKSTKTRKSQGRLSVLKSMIRIRAIELTEAQRRKYDAMRKSPPSETSARLPTLC